ncbi:hypothetical protein JOD54_000411 [Actinokineospora baliensis]|uniref:hypothetical protein n=1 Tax=Actinokineospora baliensis TaxID=547056 RepID=UPI00195BB6CC|nr:hypothetical protein [Actinokineospora baliensis]MBM7770207.1 hypothetical protein [Actinokineospora baliensis]
MSAHPSPHPLRVEPGTLAGPRVLPVHPELADLFPWGGLRRGGTVSVQGSSGLLLALLAEASSQGAWTAVVGMPDLGVLAAAEMGMAVERTALVPRPGGELAAVVAALLDGFDLVAVAANRIGDPLARKLSARARNRGAALVAVGSWPGAEVELSVARGRWSGLGVGHGHLSSHRVEVRARGRGAAARPRRTTFTLRGGTPLTPPPFEHMFDTTNPAVRREP